MRRRVIALVTFLAGLYYVLEFVVPPWVGGALDGSGAASGDIAGPFEGGAARWMLIYSAKRGDSAPRIVGRPLAGLSPLQAEGPPRALISPSYNRKDDYWGALAPHFAGPDTIYYIGLGWGNRLPQVCMAVRGRSPWEWQPLPRAVLPRGPGTWDLAGITWVSVIPGRGMSREWRMWYVGRRGAYGQVGYATSMDGRMWRKHPQPVIVPPQGGSIEAISVVEWDGGLRAWITQRDNLGAPAYISTARVNPETGALREEPIRIGWHGPAKLEPLDARVARYRALDIRPLPADVERLATLLYTERRLDGLTRVAAGHTESVDGARVPTIFRMEDAAAAEPGAAPRSTLLSPVRGQVDNLIVAVGAFSIGLGLISLALVHGRRIRRRAPAWPESAAFFVAVIAMTTVTLYDRLNPDASADDAGKQAYRVLFYGLFQPLGAAMFSLLAAYLVSASYRAFRVRNLEATLMACSAVLIMLGQVPIGHVLTQWLPEPVQIPSVMAWVLFVANNAVVRAVNFGVFVGALATAVRIWLSLDRAMMRVD